MASSVKYLVFDVESVADGQLVSQVRYPGEEMASEQAIADYRAQRMEDQGTDFIPHTYQIPVSVVVAKMSAEFELLDIVALDEPEFRPHQITDLFWRGWQHYRHPTLVSFNGRGFDIPLLELAAFRYGISVPDWFHESGRSWEQPRNRYNTRAHLDLQDLLVNFGATRFSGGLNLAARLLEKPGKMTVQGDMVQELYDAGRLAEINDYCRCDVLDTFFVFLRTRVVNGQLPLEEEQAITARVKQWLVERVDDSAGYRDYLAAWGDWANPWEATEVGRTCGEFAAGHS